MNIFSLAAHDGLSLQLKQLQTQNALLREKSIEARKENDLLVEKIQRLQSKISTEVLYIRSYHKIIKRKNGISKSSL
jgi:hypothetical protein